MSLFKLMVNWSVCKLSSLFGKLLGIQIWLHHSPPCLVNWLAIKFLPRVRFSGVTPRVSTSPSISINNFLSNKQKQINNNQNNFFIQNSLFLIFSIQRTPCFNNSFQNTLYINISFQSTAYFNILVSKNSLF